MAPRMTADERRETVLSAAVVEFARRGLHGTSTEDIARRAGISQPYLFRLFGSKKDLFIAVIERTWDCARAVVFDAIGGHTGEDAKVAIATAYGKFLADRDVLLAQMQAYAAADDPDIRRATQRCFRRLWVDVAETTGLDEEQMVNFMAHGLLLNAAAAIDLSSAMHIGWLEECLHQG